MSLVRPVDVALTYLAVREVGGNNRGPEVERFLRMVGRLPGHAWCAAFASVCVYEAYSQNWLDAGNVGPFDPKKLPIPMTAGVWVMWSSVIPKALKSKDSPEVGDVFIIDHGLDVRTNLRKGHCGFVASRPIEGRFKTVEGNTNSAGSRDGHGVHKGGRAVKECYGFIKVNPKEEGFPNV